MRADAVPTIAWVRSVALLGTVAALDTIARIDSTVVLGILALAVGMRLRDTDGVPLPADAGRG